MRNGLIGEVFYITWKGYGVMFDNIVEAENGIIFYISVPSNSYHVNVKGDKMSGRYLAKRFQEVLTEMGIKNLVVKAKVRDEYWTKEKSDAAQYSARKELFRSQA